jgi:hypothetical protein
MSTRIRIGSCGIIDVLMYDSRQDISLLQQEDLSMFGRLIFDLCSNDVASITSLQETLKSVSRQYSTDLLNLIHFLLSDRAHKVGSFNHCLRLDLISPPSSPSRKSLT